MLRLQAPPTLLRGPHPGRWPARRPEVCPPRPQKPPWRPLHPAARQGSGGAAPTADCKEPPLTNCLYAGSLAWTRRSGRFFSNSGSLRPPCNLYVRLANTAIPPGMGMPSGLRGSGDAGHAATAAAARLMRRSLPARRPLHSAPNGRQDGPATRRMRPPGAIWPPPGAGSAGMYVNRIGSCLMSPYSVRVFGPQDQH